MDIIAGYQGFITKMLSSSTVQGMKALLMDDDTTRMVGMVCSLTEVIGKEVYVVERIQEQAHDDAKQNAAIAHLKAVVFLRPTRESVEALCAALRKPRFKEYHVFFSNTLSPELMRMIAEADAEHELVRQMHEFYADYVAVLPHVFTVEITSNTPLYHTRQSWRIIDRQNWARQLDAVYSIIHTHKLLPTIRYTQASDLTRQFATDLARRIRESEGLCQFPQQRDTALLLILDRRDDPVTPLLLNWTYQAMLHEHLGIWYNTVDVSSIPDLASKKSVVLAAHQDPFFASNCQKNYGELVTAVRNLTKQYQEEAKITQKLDTIEDLQRFADKYPAYKQMLSNVAKHMGVTMELSRLMQEYDLVNVSELEQNIVCTSSQSACLQQLNTYLDRSKHNRIPFENKLKLVMLYALRYETDRAEILRLKDQLRGWATNENQLRRIDAIDEVLRIAGMASRGSDLFGTKGSVLSRVSSLIGGRQAENALLQHRPLLQDIIMEYAKGKLKVREFPALENEASLQPQPKCDVLFVYILGGITYEECAAVANLNAQPELGIRIILGGPCVHNTKTYINDLLQIETSTSGASATSAPTRTRVSAAAAAADDTFDF